MNQKWLSVIGTLLLILTVGAPAGAGPQKNAPGVDPTPALGTVSPGKKAPRSQGDDPAKAPSAKGSGVGATSYSPANRVAAIDEEFVADTGSGLDFYAYRSDGPLLFPIAISRYFGPVDAEGHLLHPELIEGQKATLTLRVWDVDQDTYTSACQPEVDWVSVNGQSVTTLSGADSQWSTVSVDIPVASLRFPSAGTEMSAPTSATNWIRIDIDNANIGGYECWAVQVDWGRLVIKGARPVVLVHGFVDTEETWSAWVHTFAPEAGLPVYAFSFNNNHGSWIDHVTEEGERIAIAKRMFGVEKVNIVAHSKGGIDSRGYLITGNNDVDKLIMIGTPNAGSPLADMGEVAKWGLPKEGRDLVDDNGEPALSELTTDYMEKFFNHIVHQYPHTRYYTIAGDWDPDGWVEGRALIWGRDDGVVAISSVEALSYSTSLGHTSHYHTDLPCCRDEWNLARRVLIPGASAASTSVRPTVKGTPHLTSAPGEITLSTAEASSTTGGTNLHPITLEAGAPAILGLVWPKGAPTSITLTAPDGTDLTTGGPGVELQHHVDPVSGLTYHLFAFSSPTSGPYQLAVTAAGPDPFHYVVTTGTAGGPHLTAQVTTPVVHVGEAALIQARMDWGGGLPTATAITATVNAPDGAQTPLTLNDEGTGPDTTAHDGIYTGVFTPSAQGFFTGIVRATSTDPAHPIARLTMTGLQVLSPSDRLLEMTSHRGEDYDADGIYNALAVQVTTSVTTAGTYLATAQLTDSAGNYLAPASWSGSLSPSSSAITFRFDGEALAASGFRGDLRLADLSLIRADGTLADLVLQAGTLHGYNATDFGGARTFRVLPGITDEGVDLNGNGQFDVLHVNVPVEVVTPGWYSFNARLIDSTNHEIDWASGETYLMAGDNPLTLEFEGARIGANGVDGPYKVRDLSLYGSSGQSLNVVDLHTTQAFRFAQFEGAHPADTTPPIWPAGSRLTGDSITGSGVHLTWTPATDETGVTEYRLFQDGALIATTSATSQTVAGLRNNRSYTFRVEAADLAGNQSSSGPTASITTLGPELILSAPLSPTTPADFPAGSVLPIRFRWLVDGTPTLDRTVAVRIRDASNRLVSSFTFGSGITYDTGVGEYQQLFDPSRYGLRAGSRFQVQVYMGGKLRTSAWVNLR